MKENSKGNFIYDPKTLELCLTQPFISSLLLQHKGNFKIHYFQILTFIIHPLSDHHTIVIPVPSKNMNFFMAFVKDLKL